MTVHTFNGPVPASRYSTVGPFDLNVPPQPQADQEPSNPPDNAPFRLILEAGNAMLKDKNDHTLWETGTRSTMDVALKLKNDGNLVLNREDGAVLWQSYTSHFNWQAQETYTLPECDKLSSGELLHELYKVA